MSDDSVVGGNHDAGGEARPPEERQFSMRKVIAITLSLVLIFTVIGVWFFVFRHWSIREVAGKIVGDSDAPGFEAYLAGRTVVVSGTVTQIHAYSTSLGPLTLIELDEFGKLHLVEWSEPAVKVSDFIVRDVHFEWSQINDDKRVLSPQLDAPGLKFMTELSSIFAAMGYNIGVVLIQSNDPGSDETILEVRTTQHGAFPLNMFNATLRRGKTSWLAEAYELWSGYVANPEIDFIGNLENDVGENQVLRFIDADSNDMFNDGDYFRADLDRPSTDSAIMTYLFGINDGHVGGIGILTGLSYIVMTNQGVLWLSGGTGSFDSEPRGRLSLLSESESNGSITSELIISDVWGPRVSPQFSHFGLQIRTDVPQPYITCPGLVNGEECSEGQYSIGFSDKNMDGYMSEGDIFSISGLVGAPRCTFRIDYGGYGTRTDFTWIPGIGSFTGNLPIVEWEEPVALDYPVNRTFKLQIGSMHGIPAVGFGDEREWMAIDVISDGLRLLSSENLTQYFNVTLPDLRVSFVDADGNGYVGGEDYFICESFGPSEIQISLSYVSKPRSHEPARTLIFWPVTWQSG